MDQMLDPYNLLPLAVHIVKEGGIKLGAPCVDGDVAQAAVVDVMVEGTHRIARRQLIVG